MKNIKERLEAFIAFKGISNKQFEKTSGLGNGFVSKIGDTIRTQKLELISTAFPELNKDWLVRGVGEMLKSEAQSASIHANGISTNYQGNFNDVYTSIGGGSAPIRPKKGIVSAKGEIEKYKIENERLKQENESLKSDIESLKEILKLKNDLLNEKERLIKTIFKE